ncbi:MAG: hypothetical protein ACW99A_17995 [Candidatus Kariarchaeaceae archaeon]
MELYREKKEGDESQKTTLVYHDSSQTDYEKEINKLDHLEKTADVDPKFTEKVRMRNLTWIAIITSILGLLQIYTSGLLDSINTVAVIFGTEKTIDGYYMIISGFIYFLGIVLFYINFNLARRIFILGNGVHLFILYRIYGSLSTILFYLETENTSGLPSEIQNFLDNVSVLRFLMFLFGLCYVLHVFFMYQKELLNIRYR